VSLRLAILGFLERGPLTGYELKTRWLDDKACHLWSADQSQVYRTLDRLEHEEETTSKIIEQRGRPDRIVYSLTPKGSRTLRETRRHPLSLPPSRDPFLLRFYLLARGDDEELVSLLNDNRIVRQNHLEKLRASLIAKESELPRNATHRRDIAIEKLTLRAALSKERVAIDWIDDTLEMVIAGEIPPPATDKSSHKARR